MFPARRRATRPIQSQRMPENSHSSRSPGKHPGRRPDLASIGGLMLALFGILGGLVLEKGKVQDVSQVTAALIVMGGTLGAVMVTTPLDILLRALRRLSAVFLESTQKPDDVIEQI